jgi:hypothetical protein
MFHKNFFYLNYGTGIFLTITDTGNTCSQNHEEQKKVFIFIFIPRLCRIRSKKKIK